MPIFAVALLIAPLIAYAVVDERSAFTRACAIGFGLLAWIIGILILIISAARISTGIQ